MPKICLPGNEKRHCLGREKKFQAVLMWGADELKRGGPGWGCFEKTKKRENEANPICVGRWKKQTGKRRKKAKGCLLTLFPYIFKSRGSFFGTFGGINDGGRPGKAKFSSK